MIVTYTRHAFDSASADADRYRIGSAPIGLMGTYEARRMLAVRELVSLLAAAQVEAEADDVARTRAMTLCVECVECYALTTDTGTFYPLCSSCQHASSYA